MQKLLLISLILSSYGALWAADLTRTAAVPVILDQSTGLGALKAQVAGLIADFTQFKGQFAALTERVSQIENRKRAEVDFAQRQNVAISARTALFKRLEGEITEDEALAALAAAKTGLLANSATAIKVEELVQPFLRRESRASWDRFREQLAALTAAARTAAR
ncbi:MAG TPA: hypothetical protein VJJ83_00050 [Candidatus Babeliales bacterium]|nr:hypothetical protein [Candidatus Babeliales bacterium]